MILSFLFFIVLVLFFINKKTSYIGVLEKEIKILEGGNLDYPITLKGRMSYRLWPRASMR